MLQAVIETGGKQFSVIPGDIVRVPRMDAKVGDSVEFNQVLTLTNESEIKIGRPTVSGASVKGIVLEQARGTKIIVFKFKRTKQYKRKQGHRQYFTAVKIESIS